MKKNRIRIFAAALTLILLCACLTSCGKISGTYAAVGEDVEITSYKFSLFSDKVIWNYVGFEFEGTYEIDEEAGKIYITILDDRLEKSYSKSGSSIFIDGVEYVKE